MPNDKGYERMTDLVASVQRALVDLEAGRLDAEGLERCTDEARALYERLVVLRHKVREGRPQAAPSPAEPPLLATPPLRLDTRPVEPALRQTSLIDAIAESEAVPEKPARLPAGQAGQAEAPKPAPPPPPKERAAAPPKPAAEKKATLADRMEHAPVADLHKAIALSQKFWFVAELFGGRREAYEKAIDTLNGMTSFADAKAFIDREVTAKVTKPPADDALIAFLELVQRRFS